MKSTRELTRADFARHLRRSQRERIMRGELEPGDVAALRRFIGLSQAKFAEPLGISVHTLLNWEQDRRTPELWRRLKTDPFAGHRVIHPGRLLAAG